MARDDYKGADVESDAPSFVYYFHYLLLCAGRMLGMVLDFYNSLFDVTAQDKAKIYGNISTWYAGKGNRENALHYAKKVAFADPGNPEAHYRLGVALASAGQPKNALSVFDRVLELKPAHRGAIARKSSLLLKFKDFAGAASCLEKAVAMSPGKAHIHYLLGIAYEGLADLDQAIASMEKAIELDPEDVRYHQHLGFLNVRREDHATAAKSFTRVMELERELDDEEY